jgi:TolB-like protein/DNA-binding winged helix-turn-helix (wHTH) protein/tetratricopeptide (TPR) repeat protein
MGSPAPRSRIISFADCTIDLLTAELCRSGDRIILQDQPFQILTALLENPGELVTREELTKRLWPAGTFVDFDQSLNKAVARLREALGDSAEKPHLVETLVRKGYRWIGPPVAGGGRLLVEKPDREEREGREERSKSSVRVSRYAYLLLVPLLAAGAWWAFHRIGISGTRASSAPIRSVAVLPLQNLLGDASKEYLVDGITDSLVTDLARTTTARVISRTSAMHYKGTRKTLPEIASELKVDAIVEGSVSGSEGSLRINLQLIVAKTDSHLWARVYEGDARHIPSIQDQFVRDIADQLPHSLSDANGGTRSITSRPRSGQGDASDYHKDADHAAVGVNLNRTESQDLYLHGLYYSNKMTKEGLEKGVSYFSQAVTANRQNKLAYIGLAESYCSLADLGFAPPNHLYPLAKDAALRALALDDDLAEAHSVLGWINYTYDWDSDRAEREFLRAIELNANYSAGHALYGEYLARRGRIAESEQQLTEASQLDPLSLPIVTEMYLPYYLSRRYGPAIDVSRRVLEMDPTFGKARGQLIFLYELTGHIDAAVQEQFRAEILEGVAPETATKRTHTLQSEIARHGARAYWEQKLKDSLPQRDNNWADPNYLAFIEMRLGRKEEALNWLERAVKDRNAEFDMQNDPEFDELSGEPRFQKLVSQMRAAQQ